MGNAGPKGIHSLVGCDGIIYGRKKEEREGGDGKGSGEETEEAEDGRVVECGLRSEREREHECECGT